MTCAPIALFVYNRVWHTQQTVEALLNNFLASKSDLIIFSDGAKRADDVEKVNKVREYIKQIDGFKSIAVFENETNKGLANSIISGVSHVLDMNEQIIVLEDDIVTSPYFLSYMNQGLHLYKNDHQVISIHGYVYPIKESLPKTFFLRGADCWGWATWKRGWQLFEKDGKHLLQQLTDQNLINLFDFDASYPYSKMLSDQTKGLNDSWAVRWYASAFLKEKLTLYPNTSLVKNIGLDNSGTHSGSSNNFDGALVDKEFVVERIALEDNTAARKSFANYFRKGKRSFGTGLMQRIAKLFS